MVRHPVQSFPWCCCPRRQNWLWCSLFPVLFSAASQATGCQVEAELLPCWWSSPLHPRWRDQKVINRHPCRKRASPDRRPPPTKSSVAWLSSPSRSWTHHVKWSKPQQFNDVPRICASKPQQLKLASLQELYMHATKLKQKTNFSPWLDYEG